MKRIICIALGLMSWLGVFGQKVVVDKVDTSQITLFHQLTSGIDQHPGLWVIDDKPMKDSLANQLLKNINPKDVLEVSILKESSANNLTGSATSPSPTVLIITKQYAIAQYQKKLGAFSADYKKEVESEMKYNHDDLGMFYIVVIDGDAQYLNRDDLIRKLYNTPVTQIVEVDFSKQQTCCGINKWVQVYIKN